jgi:hypothetical protein
MICKSFGLLFYLKKPKGYTQGDRPIYMRITIDGMVKEISTQRKCDPGLWDPHTGRTRIQRFNGSTDPGRALN